MLATATRAELRPHGFHALPQSLPLVEVMECLAPSWIPGWVEDLIEDNPWTAYSLAPLWRAGLCRRPESDSVILAYYDSHRSREFAEHPEFLERDVWRFFEVEGGGELSLAAHDKYCRPGERWSERLQDLARAGKLDRTRLLDASIDALERDFGQFRAGWYSRLHDALSPSLQEQAERCERYLHLLGSSVPPTVALALKALTALDKAGEVPVDDLLLAIPPALLARQKSAATAALKLLASTARRAPARAAEIATVALTALVSESADVQQMALDLVDRLGATRLPEVQAALAGHRDGVAPSLRARLSAMIPGSEEAAGGELPEEPDSGPVAAAFAPLVPAASFEEALSACLAVLEDPRNPLAVERAVDGVSRFGPAGAEAPDRLSPLAKRAGQIFAAARDQKIRQSLAALGRAWCGDGLPGELVREARSSQGLWFPEHILPATFLERCDEIIVRVRSGHALPLLSLPSDTSGEVGPADLLDRLERYRQAGVDPGTVDLALALTRLGRDGRASQRDRVDTGDASGRAIAFALGADGVVPEDGPVWASAWLARSDDGESPWPSSEAEPDGGTAAQYDLQVEKTVSGAHSWCQPAALITPPLRNPDRKRPASLLHQRNGHGWRGGEAVGCAPADFAWASLVRPGDPEAFLANAINALDPDQKLADHPCIAYLDAFDRLRGEAGPMACAVLAFFLASEDKALVAQMQDKLARLIDGRLIATDRLASAILPFMLVGTFPSMRWTRALAAVAGAGARHRAFVRDVIAGLMTFEPALAPRDIGGMIELLYELQVAAGAPFGDAPAIACLSRLDGGGKAAKYSKRLLALRPD